MATTLVQAPRVGAIASPASASPIIAPPSPGNWRHPKFAEIVSRESASTFSERDFRRAGASILLLLLSLLFSTPIYEGLSSTSNALALPEPTTAIFCGLTATRLYLLYSLVLALRPLRPAIKAKDKIEDIPLTPSQRSLLGLEPLDSGRASTDSSAGYITPPRYRRFSGSLSNNSWSSPIATDRRSTSATYYSSSPLSGTRNFSPNASNSPFRMGARLSGTPFSPSASPLLQKAIAVKKDREAREGADLARRQTLGTPSSGLGRSRSLRERGQRASDVGVDSPSDGPPRRNPGLNYKWIYETGGSLPKSETMQF